MSFGRLLVPLGVLFLFSCAPVKPRPASPDAARTPPPGTNATESVEKAASFFKNMGLAAMAEGNYAKAIAYFTKGVKVTPDDPVMWKLLGDAYAAAKFYPEAERAYLKALELKPDYGEAMFGLGVLYKEWGRLEEALPWLEKAAALPTYEERYRAFYQLAQIYKSLGNEELYLKNLQVAVNLYPYYGEALLELARHYGAKGDLETAKRYYLLYLNAHPGDDRVRLELARLLVQNGRYEEAKALLKKMVTTSQNPEAVAEAYRLINEILLKEASSKGE